MEVVLVCISIFLVLSVSLSLIRNDFWIFKILEYPRLQKFFMICFVIGCWYYLWPVQNIYYRILLGALVLCCLYLAYKIWPYTIFFKKEMIRVPSEDPDNEVKIFSANVLQENKQYGVMVQQIREADPDIIFLLETDAAWEMGTRELKKDYPYTLIAPLDNTYGLLFYSRLKLAHSSINYLVKDDLPSIETEVFLPSGEKMQIWGVHPEPPVPGESLYSTAKDKELMKVALKAKKCMLPSIVIGDLNDVAWSHTTELFRKTSELLDPRRGRGFYNTFSAHHWFIRYPLDYIFCSKEFGLISMTRMPKNGSDHFATLTHLALRKDIIKEQDPPKADQKEMEEATEMAAQAVKD